MDLKKYFSRKRKDESIKLATRRCASCNAMHVKGSELIFISVISRTGEKIEMIGDKDMRHLNDTTFRLNCLSITNKTYIACEFNSFVVRLKNDVK